jgi:hypothetical protein
MINVTDLSRQFEEGNKTLADPTFLQAMNIAKLIDNSRIEVSWVKEPYGYTLKVFAKVGNT